MAINDFIGALVEARNAVDDLNTRIAVLENKRAEIANTPPHADDIIAAYRRGLDTAAQDYERRLRVYLNDKNAAHSNMAEVVKKTAAQLLTIPAIGPSMGHEALFHDPTLGFGGFPLDPAAVTYFIRDQIAERIPVLVAKFCPGAQNGLRQAERAVALEKVDIELARLRAERDELLTGLDEARAAAAPVEKLTLQ